MVDRSWDISRGGRLALATAGLSFTDNSPKLKKVVGEYLGELEKGELEIEREDLQGILFTLTNYSVSLILSAAQAVIF